MNPLDGLFFGLSVMALPQNILAVGLGVILGTLVGVLPGLGPVGAIAILLPITMTMPAESSLIMLAGIYYGSQYGGSTTSILANVPGEVCSVITAIEGYEMSKNGRPGAALAVSAVGSFIAGTIGVVLLTIFAPKLATVALAFGPPEFFTMALLGLFTLSRISGAPLWQSLLALSLGLVMATVGIDPISFVTRYSFGISALSQGIGVVPVVMGLFGIAEVFRVVERAGGMPRISGVKFRELFPTAAEWIRSFPAFLRGTVIGFFIGLIPGPSPVISTFFSYRVERHFTKHPEEFGHGAIEGVAGPEASNNAAGSASMIPLLSLGIPFTPGTAMLLAGLLIQGVQPGPLLITERPEIFWGVVASLYIGNIALLILNFPLVGLWVNVLRIPQGINIAVHSHWSL
jgi:putative tricarboxylic transport membrane protein